MTAWIYILSKFTQEALLMEAFAICALTASYTGFWILRKRRHGPVDKQVPAPIVKDYLNDLIGDASDLRTQLFGLLAAGAAAGGTTRLSIPSLTGGADTAALDAKLAEQARSLEKVVGEKSVLEKELEALRAKGSAGPSEDTKKMQDKLGLLEARLAEYSVIEDDLANLKRLQQENAALKAKLAAGPAVAAPEAAKPAAAEAAAPVVDTPPPAAAPAASVTDAPKAAAEPTAAEAAKSAQDAVDAAFADAAGTTPDAGFEGLVDQVEKSLQSTPAAAAPAPAAEAAAPAAAPAQPALAPVEKSDEDLIAEFEKMLNS